MNQLILPQNTQLETYGVSAEQMARVGMSYQMAMDSMAGGINRLGFKGSRFHVHIDGADVVLPQTSVDVIFLGASEHNHRTWYAKGFDQAGDNEAPTCYSSTGVAPDVGIPASDRQGVDCKSCPRNVENSHPAGQGKACGTSRRIAVALPKTMQGGGRVLQARVSGISLFGPDYPAQNLLNFQGYMRQIGSIQREHNRPPLTYLTQIHFDAGQSVPVTRFSVGDVAAHQGTTMRPAAPEDVEFAVRVLTNGEVAKLLSEPVSQPKKQTATLPAPTMPAYVPPVQTAPPAYVPPVQTAPPAYVPPVQTAPPAYVPPAPPVVTGTVHMATGFDNLSGFDDAL